MKQLHKFLLCISSAALLTACLLSTAMADEVTASASAQGMGGQVTVTLTMDGDAITAVEIEGPDETPGIGAEAVIQMQAAMLEQQTIEVDSMTGATITSDAIHEAAAKAVELIQGGGEEAEGAGEAAELGFTAGTYSATAEG